MNKRVTNIVTLFFFFRVVGWYCIEVLHARWRDKMAKTDKICYCVNITRHIDMFSIPFALKIGINPLAHYLLYYYCVNTTQC